MTVSFGARLAAAFDELGQLCVGIDPHSFLLREWGLTDDAAGVREFGLRVVEAASGRAAIVKPQVAFFERHGAAGFGALEEILSAARSAGLIVIADVKRGDLGTSVEAYGEAWLSPGSPLEADAMTISAYQGVGSILAPLELAERSGKGVFVLAATSNPEAVAPQTAVIATGPRSGLTVAAGILTDVIDWNREHAAGIGGASVGSAGLGSAGVGSAGLVLGATVNFSDYGIDLDRLAEAPATPVLAPGFGHQGARFDQVGTLYGAAAPYAIVSASRSILSSGPGGIASAIAEQAAEVAAWRS